MTSNFFNIIAFILWLTQYFFGIKSGVSSLLSIKYQAPVLLSKLANDKINYLFKIAASAFGSIAIPKPHQYLPS